MHLRRIMSALLTGLLVVMYGPGVANAQELNPTVVVLDASGSMTATDSGGVMRMDAAKDAVDQFLSGVPENSPLGLITYGTGTGSSDEEKEAGCKDITVLAGLGEKPIDALKGEVHALQPRGYTPIGNSLLKANELLPKEGARSIVLISDGIDTCAPPPVCEVAKQLKDQGTDLIVHTIGFMVDEAARAELACVAQATGGTYADASSADSLAATLKQAATRTAVGYQMPTETVEFSPKKDSAPHLKIGTLDNPTRIHAKIPNPVDTYSYAKVSIPEGHRLVMGYNIVPEIGAPGVFENDYVFIPSLRTEKLSICHASNSTDGIEPYGGIPRFSHLISKVQGSSNTCSEEYYYLEIQKDADFDDLDMTIYTMPEPSNYGDPSMETSTNKRADSDLGIPAPAGEVKEITPLSQPDAEATPIAGSVVTDIVSGETHYYPTAVGWGQALDVTVEVLEDPVAEELGPVDRIQRKLRFFVANNALQDQKLIGDKDLQTDRLNQPVVFGTEYPVSFGNVATNASWLGGTHFVQVSFEDREDNITAQTRQQPVKYRITFTPVGKEVEGPIWAKEAATTTAPSPTSEAPPQAQTEEKSGISAAWWVVLVVALALLAIIVGVLTKLSKRP